MSGQRDETIAHLHENASSILDLGEEVMSAV